MSLAFPLRGVIEGFYGAFYTAPERDDLIRFTGRHGYNLYVYAPKNDRQHRARWREPYPAAIMAQFARTVEIAREAGVEFCYSLSPGVSMCYSSEDDFAAITSKLRAFYDLGVRVFSLLLDDIASEFQHDADRRRYSTYAEAHVDLCYRVYAWLKSLIPSCRMSMCPTDYHGSAPFSPYIRELGAGLHPDIDVFYTGRAICPPEIGADEVSAFAQAIRRPPLIWDNYPVNDLKMAGELHLAAVVGRDSALAGMTRGVCANLMLQAETSKIPLLTYADFLRDPISYDSERSWANAIAEVAGNDSAESLRLFAENSLYSCLGAPEAEPLQTHVNAALGALKHGDSVLGSPSVEALKAYLAALDEASYHLKFRMDNLKLRHELLPWIEKLDHWVWLGKFTLQALEAHARAESIEPLVGRIHEHRGEALAHPKRIGGMVMLPLVDWALEHLGQQEPPVEQPSHA